jgi:hypothetical protein
MPWPRALVLSLAALMMDVGIAEAQTLIGIQASPATWRLQNYVGGTGVVVYYTSSSCSQGQLTFPAGTTSDDQNRLWSLVLAAKIAGQEVGIFYYVSGSSCFIQSYYAPE